MIVGFNHNIGYRGTGFHVQTEDSGIKNPQLVTLLYHGGTIIASQKTVYADIIKVDNLSLVVEDLAKEQHKGMLRRLTKGEFDQRILGSGISLAPAPPAVEPAAPVPVIEAVVPVTTPPVIEAVVPVATPPVIEAVVPVATPPVIEAVVPVATPPVIEAVVPVATPPVIEAVVPVATSPVIEAVVPVTTPPVIEAVVPVTTPPVPYVEALVEDADRLSPQSDLDALIHAYLSGADKL